MTSPPACLGHWEQKMLFLFRLAFPVAGDSILPNLSLPFSGCLVSGLMACLVALLWSVSSRLDKTWM